MALSPSSDDCNKKMAAASRNGEWELLSRCIVLLIALHYFINRVALFINRVGLFINRVGLFINLVVTPEPPSDEDEFSSDEDALVAHLLGDESEMPGLTNKKLVTRKHERDNDLDVALNKNG